MFTCVIFTHNEALKRSTFSSRINPSTVNIENVKRTAVKTRKKREEKKQTKLRGEGWVWIAGKSEALKKSKIFQQRQRNAISKQKHLTAVRESRSIRKRCDPSTVRAVVRITAEEEEVDSAVATFVAAADADICDDQASTTVRRWYRRRTSTLITSGHNIRSHNPFGRRIGTSILEINTRTPTTTTTIIISTGSCSRRNGNRYQRLLSVPTGQSHRGSVIVVG